MPQGQLAEEPVIPEKLVHDETSEKASNNYSPENALQEYTSLSKKKKKAAQMFLRKERVRPQNALFLLPIVMMMCWGNQSMVCLHHMVVFVEELVL